MRGDELSLGAAIRVWRDRLTPEQVGLPSGHARRAAGLRREELADLASISVDYVVRLEQGRATTPSPQVVASLARALQLTNPERDHFYLLAGLKPPSDRVISDHIQPGMQRLLTRMGDTPIGVFAADWRLIWWNRSWVALLGDPSPIAPEQRSLVRARFPVAGEPGELAGWPVRSQRRDETDRAIVADLRRASARYPDDQRLAGLIHTTLAGNARFAELWESGEVAHHAEERKTIEHPTVGDVTVDCDVLSGGDSDLKAVIYTAVPGSEDATKLELALVTVGV